MASFLRSCKIIPIKDRYLLTATLRADGASNFAKITGDGDISLLSLWVGFLVEIYDE